MSTKDAIDGVGRYLPRYQSLIYFVQSLMLAAFLVIAITFPDVFRDPEKYIFPVCVVLLALYIWTLGSWWVLTGDLFDAYTLFMTAAFVFNAGLAFLEVFHLNSNGILQGLFPPKLILETLWLVTICLAAFHTGALISTAFGWTRPRLTQSDHARELESRSLRIVGWVLIGISAIPTLIVFKGLFAAVNTSGYFGIYQRQVGTGMTAWSNILSELLVPGSLFLLAGSRNMRKTRYVSLGIVLIYCVLMFLLGERGLAIMPLMAFLWLWHRTVKKISKTALVALAVLLLVVLIPLLSAFRGTAGPERYSVAKAVNAYNTVENPAVAGIEEMGSSMQTVSYTMELVPKTRAFDLGKSYYYAMLTTIPNFFWRIHPAIARGLADKWLIETIDPLTAQRGGGLGYSFIAEAFLNFGWWGSAIFMCFIGFLFGSLLMWADRSGDIARLAMVATFLSFFLFYARGESAFIIRALVWYSVLPYLAVLFLQGKLSHRQRVSSEIPIGPYGAEGREG